MAAEWIPCSSGFIEADVIRWTEGVWRKPRRRRGRAVNIGELLVIAEVLRDEGGWLDLLIRGCSVVSEKPGHKVLPLPNDQPLHRTRHTVETGKPERLLWSDEGACADAEPEGTSVRGGIQALASWSARERDACRTWPASERTKAHGALVAAAYLEPV